MKINPESRNAMDVDIISILHIPKTKTSRKFK